MAPSTVLVALPCCSSSVTGGGRPHNVNLDSKESQRNSHQSRKSLLHLGSGVLGYSRTLGHHHFGGYSNAGSGAAPWGNNIRRYGDNFVRRSFWQGSEDLLQQVVQDLSAAEGTGTLSQIGSSTLSQIGSTIAPAIDATSGLPRTELLGAAGVAWVYITASPGILLGAFDSYIVAPFQSVLNLARGRKSWNATDFVLGNWIGEGSFGTVYTGALLSKALKASAADTGKRMLRMEELTKDAKFEKVVLKKVKVRVEGAEECAEMEEWFNSRVCRAAPDACAEYLGSFISDMTRGPFVEGGKWLVWKYEGTMTLANFMKQQNFPGQLEEAVFGPKGLSSESDPIRRRSVLIQRVMRQLLTSVKKVHSIGIVHRDIKPSNLVITQSGKLKIIDFGAAIDLRTGKNFVPDRGMLDPDYCPPELFVMPEETPIPPAAPLAAILSPLVCIMNSPDLFDTYSVGVILMQLACASLRTPIGLQVFKNEMAASDYNLDRWRKTTKMKTNFEILDLDGGMAWDLAKKLLRRRGLFRRGRLSAAGALRHPYFLFGRDQVASFFSKFSAKA
ncbi:unnamed protein product [Calypogeia fissa]